MTTALVSKSSDIALRGAPHCPGDDVVIEWEGCFITARVLEVTAAYKPIFGLRWSLEVEPYPLGLGTTVVRVDDNGRNHTIGRRVRPSLAVGE